MIEILKEESLEERERRMTTGKKQINMKKQDKDKGDKEEEALLPKNIRQVGDAGEYTKVYFEDYVMTYIKQQAAFGKDREDVLIFYGDKRRISGKTYYFVSGALKVEDVNSCLCPILFNQEDWKDINECARRFFSNLTVLGWALLCEGEELELKTRIMETQEEFFGDQQPIFMEYSKSEKEEKVYLYQRGKMYPQTGHYIYYDKNEKMQNYMIHEKDDLGKVEEESVDHAARQFRMVVQGKQEEKKKKRTNLLLYSTALTLAIVVMLIGITLLGNYEKMENMEKVLYEMAEGETQEEYPINAIEDRLNIMEANNSIVYSELAKKGEVQLGAEQQGNDRNVEKNVNVEQGAVGAGTNASETQETASIIVEEKTAETQVVQGGENQAVNGSSTENQTTNGQGNDIHETESAPMKAEESSNLTGESEETKEETKEQAKEQAKEQTTVADTTEGGTTEKETDAEHMLQESAEETVVSTEHQVYVIKKGDTLEKINRLFYGSENRIKEICELNQIENQDNICYGEKIILPN